MTATAEIAARLAKATTYTGLLDRAAAEVADRVCAKAGTTANWAAVKTAAAEQILAWWRVNARHLYVGWHRENRNAA